MDAAQAPTVSIVVPVYNAERTLCELVERIDGALSTLDPQWQLIFVDDGSRDGSTNVIRELASRDQRIRGIQLMRNYGQHNALLAGIRAAEGDVIVTLDDDLQNPPEEIPKLLATLDDGYDVVYGTPLHEQHGLWRDMASRMTKLALQSAMGADTARRVSAFRAFRRDVRSAFADYQSAFVSIDVLLTWGTSRFGSIAVRHDERSVGRSNYTFRKLVRHSLNMMTGFSVLPLQVASLLGFGFTLFGLVVLAYVIGRYIVDGGSVAGFPFLASIIALFSGAQLFALGIIGEYLARMHFRTMGRPPYAVRSDSGCSTDARGS